MVNVIISQATQANIQSFSEFVQALDKGNLRTLENVRIDLKTLENEVLHVNLVWSSGSHCWQCMLHTPHDSNMGSGLRILA